MASIFFLKKAISLPSGSLLSKLHFSHNFMITNKKDTMMSCLCCCPAFLSDIVILELYSMLPRSCLKGFRLLQPGVPMVVQPFLPFLLLFLLHSKLLRAFSVTLLPDSKIEVEVCLRNEEEDVGEEVEFPLLFLHFVFFLAVHHV